MILTVVSGKGGAGKTSIAASVAHILPYERLVLVDADVDAPNLALALGLEEPVRREEWFGGTVAEYTGGPFDPGACPFGAIGRDGRVFELLCEGCGVCVRKFPGSFRMKSIKNADIVEYRWRSVPLVTAELEPGRSGSGKVITKVREDAEKVAETENRDVMLVDAAAGRGCPVIASVRGADLALLVVDNSPTGISDAQMVVNVLHHFQVPFLFVVNRWDLAPELGEKAVELFTELGGTFIGKVPYTEALLKTYPVPASTVLEHVNVDTILRRI